MRLFVSLVCGMLLYGLCGCARDSATLTGTVTSVIGSASIIRSGERKDAKVGDTFTVGDIIETGAKSMIIAELDNKNAQVEIQENAVFNIAAAGKEEKVLSVDRGNVWFQVKKLLKGGSYTMKTHTTVASVRGTKFYTFKIGDYDGTCHCEGNVDFQGTAAGYHKMHHKDELVVTKGGKTVLFNATDFPFMYQPGSAHRHSMIDDSPLGGKAPAMTQDQLRKFLAVIEKGFLEAK